MNFWQWFRSLFSPPKARYDPASDPVVQELNHHTRRLRRQSAAMRLARTEGRPVSYEEMFGRLPDRGGPTR